MFRPATPLGQRPRGAIHHNTGPVNPVSELDRSAGLLATRAHLRRSGDSARRLLSILTSIVHTQTRQRMSRSHRPLAPMR